MCVRNRNPISNKFESAAVHLNVEPSDSESLRVPSPESELVEQDDEPIVKIAKSVESSKVIEVVGENWNQKRFERRIWCRRWCSRNTNGKKWRSVRRQMNWSRSQKILAVVAERDAGLIQSDKLEVELKVFPEASTLPHWRNTNCDDCLAVSLAEQDPTNKSQQDSEQDQSELNWSYCCRIREVSDTGNVCSICEGVADQHEQSSVLKATLNRAAGRF